MRLEWAHVFSMLLENTFTTILDMAGVLLPFLKWFISRSTGNGFKILNCVKQSTLFISGLQYEMVPPIHMKMLYAKAVAHNRHCYFVEFPTSMHMDTWLTGGDCYWRTVNEFMEQHVSGNIHDDSNSSSNVEMVFGLAYMFDSATPRPPETRKLEGFNCIQM
ncbi:alpha/beta hydrolase domain-containing protein WAV2-like [Spinacia oleracea]|uniref:Alpha/beta hydrolase domain-containing protein WAV2-like n=1 Tax=Spinacia oleracea TaxID=3562 RepID=A0ABM3QYU5_SPIOL|nr:alpha/beta hydrolase domain-containing protein WAV2-like [Spinacia oleracea]